ncbi:MULTISPECIES: hotdog fold thioesterase [Sinomonas]|jgi:acyl-CoA thioesterase|uniref:hotdog fold thioesterase n=1 Tax=Sinomonas TaxID=596707 RepID=UPI000B5E9E94|nr:hotdog fold thioesterase [Sinomonas sp. R1AF57]ASN52841.1 phenylacetic acid degradation protein [Sinomonas sp. R1AF57]
MSEVAPAHTLAHPILTDDYATEWMGLTVLELGDGTATVATTLRREMLNGFGIAHGGMLFAIADSAFALACNPHTPDEAQANTVTVASGVDVNFLAPAHEGELITAVAARRAHAGRSGIYDVQVFSSPAGTPHTAEAPGRLVAEFRGRSRTIPKR